LEKRGRKLNKERSRKKKGERGCTERRVLRGSQDKWIPRSNKKTREKREKGQGKRGKRERKQPPESIAARKKPTSFTARRKETKRGVKCGKGEEAKKHNPRKRWTASVTRKAMRRGHPARKGDKQKTTSILGVCTVVVPVWEEGRLKRGKGG